MESDRIHDLITENLRWTQSIAEGYALSVRHVESSDIRQEAALALAKAAQTFDPAREIPFRAYAHKCITNRLNSLYGESQKQSHYLTILDSPINKDDSPEENRKDLIPAATVDPAQEAYRNQVRQMLTQGKQNLTPLQQNIVEARSRGESFKELADRLGSSKQAVQQSSARAMAQLRSGLEANGVRGAAFMPEAKSEAISSKSKGRLRIYGLIAFILVLAWIIYFLGH